VDAAGTASTHESSCGHCTTSEGGRASRVRGSGAPHGLEALTPEAPSGPDAQADGGAQERCRHVQHCDVQVVALRKELCQRHGRVQGAVLLLAPGSLEAGSSPHARQLEP
jgi:hypothetical protein